MSEKTCMGEYVPEPGERLLTHEEKKVNIFQPTIDEHFYALTCDALRQARRAFFDLTGEFPRGYRISPVALRNWPGRSYIENQPCFDGVPLYEDSTLHSAIVMVQLSLPTI